MKYLNKISIVIDNDDIITDKMTFEKWDYPRLPVYKVKTANGNVKLLHLHQIVSITPIHNQSLLITLFFNNNYYEIICDSIERKDSWPTILCVINPTNTSPVLPIPQSFDSLSLEAIEIIKRDIPRHDSIYYQFNFHQGLDPHYSALLNHCFNSAYLLTNSSIKDIINNTRILSIEILRCNREINPQKEISSFYNTSYNDRLIKSSGTDFPQIHICINFDDKKLHIWSEKFLREYSTRSMDYDEWGEIDCLMIFQTRYQLRLYVCNVLDICKKDEIEIEYSKLDTEEYYSLTSKGGYNWAEKFGVEFIYTKDRYGTPR